MIGEQDVVIIGAPRSGTNMLRDVLTALPGFGTWPCDEINPIWRHGNRNHPTDEFTKEMATDAVQGFIRERFEHIRARQRVRRVVEKTCANSLRVGFVREVLPDAKYIWIVRDGLDAAVSATERWDARFDLSYAVAKARFVPASDVPWYALRFLSSRLSRRRGSAAQAGGWWGPRMAGGERLLGTRPLDEVATLQWRACMAASAAGFDGMPDSQLLVLSYASFVNDPLGWLERLGEFLGVPTSDAEPAVANVSAKSVGKGRGSLSEADLKRLTAVAEPELTRFGYA